MNSRRLVLDKLAIITIVMFIYFEPQILKVDDYKILVYIDSLYKILKIFGAVFIFSMYLKQNKVSKLFWSMLLFQFLAFVSTIINTGAITRFIGPALTTMVMIMAAEILINDNKLFVIIKRCLIYFRVCFVINVISLIVVDFFISSSNISSIYFLGIDNRFIFTYLPWITFEFLYSIKTTGKINKISILMFLFSELTLLYKFSLSAMLVSLLWILIFIKREKIVKYAKSIFLSTVLINYLIVFVKIQNIFESLLSNLKKGTTLSGRTYLWDAILKDIKNCPLLGRGMQSIEYERQFFYSNSGMEYLKKITPHAHNSYMTVLQRNGIIGLVIYFYILWICISKLAKSFTNKYSKILFVSLLIVLLLSVFDTIDCSGFYFILACSYSINLIDINDNKKKEYA